MSFPISFVKSRGDYDFISPLINFAMNGAVVAGGAVGLGAITFFALKALGFSAVAVTAVTAIPVTLGAIAILGTAIAGGICTYLLVGFVREYLKR